ncbi:Neurotransmitter-gated ion-channel ligand binding domain protein [Ancylostoma duodenale]|uniref:Neurotransmitter-gated ion-channel ligand binding domain protein n=1 Tax=Ancylostoma duodenale TaxID=51022 RepID=A0A0C2D4W6_9BILA|nr:Neurotransmitter-gated ion-channel ligand binding domain protein [Ancylostoma duodenale]
MDEKNQVITLVAWIEYQWTDYKLKWQPSEYGGIKDIRVPGNANAIWKPDVLLYNSADENFDSTYPVNYVVSHTGHVLQVPPGILKLSCKIDITYFPFDDQMCHLKVCFNVFKPLEVFSVDFPLSLYTSPKTFWVHHFLFTTFSRTC